MTFFGEWAMGNRQWSMVNKFFYNHYYQLLIINYQLIIIKRSSNSPLPIHDINDKIMWMEFSFFLFLLIRIITANPRHQWLESMKA